jgi:hypothetical protein
MNRHGVPNEDLVIRAHAITVRAKTFITALRDIQARAPLFPHGLDEPTPSDLFVMQMAAVFKVWTVAPGTHTMLPDDIMEYLHPGFIEHQAENAG